MTDLQIRYQYIDWAIQCELMLADKRVWSFQANCINKIDVMYPTSEVKQQNVADRMCATCPVVRECLLFALVNKDVNGVWGYTTESQRKQMLQNVSAINKDWQKWWNESNINLFNDEIDKFLRHKNIEVEENVLHDYNGRDYSESAQ